MTDIVERLRACGTLYFEAAAEIEHLRTTIKMLSNGKQANSPSIDAFLNCPLDRIDFGKFVTNRIRSAFYGHTVRDLVAMTENQVLRFPNTGRKAVNCIKAKLAEHGLHLGMTL